MSKEPITWKNISGLTDVERRAGQALLAVDDLRGVVLEGNVVNGVEIPPIVNGVVIR